MFKSMKCTRVEKFLPLYVAGDLKGARRRRSVERHLAECERCAQTAAQYRASRELFRAALVPPDFDAAFYEEIRNSVLARIRRDRTLAPPRTFYGLKPARFAYAASLALVLLAAALALHSYTRRTHTGVARQETIATATPEQASTPFVRQTPTPVQTGSDERTIPHASQQTALVAPHVERRGSAGAEQRAMANVGRSVNRSPFVDTNARNEEARDEASRLNVTTVPAPAHARRNPLAAMATTAQSANPVESGDASVTSNAAGLTNALHGNSRAAQSEISRIEIQTSDPNIRIIWLSPAAEETAQPLR